MQKTLNFIKTNQKVFIRLCIGLIGVLIVLGSISLINYLVGLNNKINSLEKSNTADTVINKQEQIPETMAPSLNTNNESKKSSTTQVVVDSKTNSNTQDYLKVQVISNFRSSIDLFNPVLSDIDDSINTMEKNIQTINSFISTWSQEMKNDNPYTIPAYYEDINNIQTFINRLTKLKYDARSDIKKIQNVLDQVNNVTVTQKDVEMSQQTYNATKEVIKTYNNIHGDILRSYIDYRETR